MTTTMTRMTTRERISAVLRREEVDRFPVWLKMANDTWRSAQPEPYCTMDEVELLRACGCDAMGGVWMQVDSEAPHVKVTVERLDALQRTTCETPDGTLIGEDTLDPYTNSWHPTRYMVSTAEELKALRWLYKDTSWTVDEASAADAVARTEALKADDVYTRAGAPTTPFMELLQHVIGPVNTIYLMTDEPELFREVMDLFHEHKMKRLLARLAFEKSDTLWMNENTSTTLISPQIFTDFCAPHLKAYGELILAHGLLPVHHMCGTLNALLELIDDLPAVANEAYTTRPLGDVSLAEGRTRMPSKALIGGTNATLWLDPVETIVATVAEDLTECPNRRGIFLTSAGVLPPPVSFEKAARAVAELKRL